MLKTTKLIRATFTDIWKYKGSLFPIILLVMVPVVVISLVTNSDQTLGTYGSFATLIMNVAVISTTMHVMSGVKKVSPAQAYYGGTTRLVAFVGVVGLLGLQLIPFMIGGLVYISGSTGATVGLGPVEMILLGGIWLLFSVPTFRWLTRSVFALYLVQDASVAPLAAVRQSRSLVAGKAWPVFGRMAAGALAMMAVLIIPSLAISTLPETASLLAKVATSLLQIFSALVLVPFASIYGYKLLEALGGKPTAS